MERPAAAAAKRFFLAALNDQALEDGVPLSDTEQEMFLFSKPSASGHAVDVAGQFEAAYDSDAYEAKVAKLLRRAHHRDRKIPSRAALWKESLRALKGEDFYGMVMLEQARLRVPGPRLLGNRDVLDVLPLAAAFLLFGVPAVVLSSDPFGWYLIESDWLRLAVFLALVTALWVTTITIPSRRKRVGQTSRERRERP